MLGNVMCPGLREVLPSPQIAWLSFGFALWPTLLGNHIEILRFNHPREFKLELSLLVQTELAKSRAGLGQTTDSPPSLFQLIAFSIRIYLAKYTPRFHHSTRRSTL